ncbi:ABC_transporter family protein [Hexamita inflata]|uniref:ABC_transporter family protein n=1 Tax=Hexamita inflata TaxID=28002 RepID=A0ABP1GYB3_9EUKA
MNSLIQFYIYQAKQSQVMIILLLVLPVLIPFLIYGIMLLFTNSVSNIKIRKFEVPNLPPVEQIASPPEHLIYFSYSPDEPRYKDFIDQLFQMNGISGRSRAFKDAAEAERYINIKNIVPGSKQRFDNVSFYSKVLCDDFRLYSDATNLNYQGDCLVDLSKDYEKVMFEQYKLTSSDLQIDVSQPEYRDNILFHINFLESATLLQGVPSNVTYVLCAVKQE